MSKDTIESIAEKIVERTGDQVASKSMELALEKTQEKQADKLSQLAPPEEIENSSSYGYSDMALGYNVNIGNWMDVVAKSGGYDIAKGKMRKDARSKIKRRHKFVDKLPELQARGAVILDEDVTDEAMNPVGPGISSNEATIYVPDLEIRDKQAKDAAKRRPTVGPSFVLDSRSTAITKVKKYVGSHPTKSIKLKHLYRTMNQNEMASKDVVAHIVVTDRKSILSDIGMRPIRQTVVKVKPQIDPDMEIDLDLDDTTEELK